MTPVRVVGIGQVAVGQRWEDDLGNLANKAAKAAFADAGMNSADVVIVGNMLSGILCAQENLGAYIAQRIGLKGVEALKVESACGSGGMALRMGAAMIMSGQCNTALVIGVEKMTDVLPDDAVKGLVTAADADTEAVHGATFAALNAIITRLYMDKYGYRPEDMAGFSLNAHANAVSNPYAMFREQISLEDYLCSPIVASPIRIADSPPICDGAAAVLLAAPHAAPRNDNYPVVELLASAAATDCVGLGERKDLLSLDAARISSGKVFQSAGISPAEIDLFELHDAFPVIAALSLEACGFAERGHGARLAMEGALSINGNIPIQTLGGLKARGHPVGASGVYQAVEACLQLRGKAGDNQVRDARYALTQSIGGIGASVITHLFGRN